MERSVAEELVEVLKKKKMDFISLSKLKEALPAALKKRLGLTAGSSVTQTTKAISSHLGDALMLKQKYLVFKQTDELLLCRTVQKNNGKIPRMDRIPFKKGEFLAILNQLIERGTIRVKFDNDYKPLLTSIDDAPDVVLPQPRQVSEKEFKIAYKELEGGNFYVRICDLRRHLDWTAQEFNTMLTNLRDSGKIQLQTGDTDFFTEEDIRESFVDENGFRKLTIMWRQ